MSVKALRTGCLPRFAGSHEIQRPRYPWGFGVSPEKTARWRRWESNVQASWSWGDRDTEMEVETDTGLERKTAE